MRPEFPKRAVVTAGMPYANKGLHFGHIGGVFVPADCYARFLRDRIGAENVLFISGSDCYGSTINEGYRKLKEDGAFDGSILEYVQMNHDNQTKALEAYDISLDIFEGSGLGASKDIHEQVSAELITTLYDNGWLDLDSTAQFYDAEAQTLLNGRQVLGHCPVQGCKSEHAYADECDLGHQYRPEDLLNPKSALTNTIPELKKVENWYLNTPAMSDLLREYVAWLKNDGFTRDIVADTMSEFLVPPIIFIKEEYYELYQEVESSLPSHTYRAPEKGKVSFELEFTCLEERDKARDVLSAMGIRLRTGKALVPFRITGNISWGVPAPVINDVKDLSIWCWPESLWAPLSFTRSRLEAGERVSTSLNPRYKSFDGANWKDFWCSKDAAVYQFIGQDNIFFYGVAQTALWSAYNAKEDSSPIAIAPNGQLQQTKLIANYHLQFLGKKASSSSEVKPPMAIDLLEYYTAEQLRAHFVSLGLGKKPVSFKPKPLDPSADERAADPVLKESALLTNIFNRLARSCFYEAQKSFEGRIPVGSIAQELLDDTAATILQFEEAMYKAELHTAFELSSEFIRRANKYWSDSIKAAEDNVDERKKVLVASFYLLRVAMILMHPFVPRGCELIFEYLEFEATEEEYFSWDHIFEGNEAFFSKDDISAGGHPIKELPPRTDFFRKHDSQFKD